jgi:signal transduction histidine kinase
MRERLLAAFAGLTLLTTLLFGVPRAFIVAELTRVSEARVLERQADVILAAIDAAERFGGDVDVDALAAGVDPDEGFRYRPADGPGVDGGTPLEADDLLVVRETPTGGTVEVWRDRAAVDRRIATAIVPIVVVGLGVLAVGVGLAWVLARRFARPLQQLATAAEQLGEGRFELDVPEQDVREAAAVARALRTSAARIAQQLRAEQEFSSSASHQLRTPLTGLRLRLEGLLGDPGLNEDARCEVGAAITEVDRLAATVADLLEMARTSTIGTRGTVRIDELAERSAERWGAVAAEDGRAVQVVAAEDAVVAASDHVLEQVLDVLVDNALCHGHGDVSIAVSVPAGAVRLRVQDEGDGIDGELAARIFDRHVSREGSPGEGIGLALARQLVTALGGRLVLVSGAPTTFDVLLPAGPLTGAR